MPDVPSYTRHPARNATIEGLRGFSIVLVLACHLHNMAAGAGFFTPRYGKPVQDLVVDAGHFGVMLFFCISGFLILQSLLRYQNAARFLWARAIRIYPVFVPLHLLMFVAGPFAGYEWMGTLRGDPWRWLVHFVSNALFLPGTFDLPLAQKNAWSLSYEAAFYSLAALLWSGYAAPPRSLRQVIFLITGMGLAVAFFVFHPMACFLLVGVALHAWERRRTPGQSPARWLGAATGLVALVAAFAAYTTGFLPLALVFGTVFFATVTCETGWFSAVLRAAPLRYIGKISYSVYLIHPFVFDPVRTVVGKLSLGEPGAAIVFVTVGLAGTIVVSDLSYRLIETAFTNRFLRPRRDKIAVVAGATNTPKGTEP